MKDLPHIEIYADKIHDQKPLLVEAHVDPKHKDIVINGFGITKGSAMKLCTWLNHAIRNLDKQRKA